MAHILRANFLSGHVGNQHAGFLYYDVDDRFNLWLNTFRRSQIQNILTLTACLYFIMGVIEFFYSVESRPEILWKVHIFVLPPFLFLISFMAQKESLLLWTDILLFLSPLFAASLNVYMTSLSMVHQIYLSELYLMIFWIFTISGMRLHFASISALIVFCLSLFSARNFLMYDFLMHVFWNLAALSFGFLGAFLLERSYKKAFLNELHLEELSQRDALTGLYNRAGLEQIIYNEFSRMRRDHHQFACIFIDIDYFKEVNDTYGHKVGDKVLIEISKLISTSIREHDKLVRWGGEEFIVISTQVDEQNVKAVCEHLRKHVEEHVFEDVGHLSVSIGCTLNHEGDSADSLILRADKALYEAKEKGRNQVVYTAA